MNAGYQKAMSKVLAAVLSLLMVFGNVGSPVFGVFGVYANDEQDAVETNVDEANADEVKGEDNSETSDADEGNGGEDNIEVANAESGEQADAPEDNSGDAAPAEDTADSGSDEDNDTPHEDENASSEDGESGNNDNNNGENVIEKAAPAEENPENNSDNNTKDVPKPEFKGEVYIDGANGDDENDGLTKETAVKTWDKAMEIIDGNAGTIYVCGTVVVSGTIQTKDPSTQTVKRAEGFAGNIFQVDTDIKEATFKNIHVDGEREEKGAAKGTVIAFENLSEGTLKIIENSVFENIECSGAGAVVYANAGKKKSTFEFDGATFKNNKSGGNGGAIYITDADGSDISFINSTFERNEASESGGAVYINNHDTSSKRAVINVTIDKTDFKSNKAGAEGGAVYTNGNVYTEVQSGLFESNKAKRGSALVNYNSTLSNQITIYNALITGNKSTGTEKDGTGLINNSGLSAGGINICQSSVAETTISGDIEHGAAIYDNEGPKGDIAVWDTSDLTKLKVNEGIMIGGGNHNWTQEGDKGYKANPSDEDKKKAEALATSIFRNNEAVYHGAIQSNGVVTFGNARASLRIKKIDADDASLVGGVTFNLKGKTNANIEVDRDANTFVDKSDTEHDDSGNGVASFTDIAPGTYELSEKEVKPGYKKINHTWKVVVDSKGNLKMYDGDKLLDKSDAYYDYVVKNEKIKVNISKADMSGKEIPGAKLVVKDEKGEEIDSWESIAETHLISGIAEGKYTLVEVVAPKGFEPVTTEVEFTVKVDDEGNVNVTADNAVSSAEGAVETDGNKLILKDAPYKEPETEKYVNKDVTYDFDNFDQVFEYEIMAYVPYDATKFTISDKLVDYLEFAEDANVQVFKMGADNDHETTVAENGDMIPAENYTADANEQTNTLNVTFEGENAEALRRNWIKVTFNAQIKESKYNEVKRFLDEKAKDGTKASDVADAWANYGAGDNKPVLIDKAHDGVPNKAKFTVETENNGEFKPETNTVTIEPKTTNITVKKSWKNVLWPSGTTVKFGVFKVKDGNEEKVDEIELTKEESSKTVTLPLLDGVTYTAREISVNKDGNTADVNYSDEAKTAGEALLDAIKYIVGIVHSATGGEHAAVNELKVKVKINKTDLGGAEIAGAEITVYDENGAKISSWKSEEGKTFDLELDPGSYSFEETVAPAGYAKVETKIDFAVSEDGKVNVTNIDGVLEQSADGTMVLKDTPIRKISKNELGGSELDGAKMTLTLPDGTVEEWISDASAAHEFNAVPGTYKLKEVAAPEGYTQVTTEVEFTIDDHGNITINTTEVDGGGKVSVNGDTVVLEDAPKKTVEISKNELGGDEIEGAKIVVKGKDNSGNDVNEEWTSEKSVHTLKLDPGVYTMEETVAPAAYQQITTVVEFEVKADGSVEVKTTEVNNGGKVSAKDNHIVLEDAPEKPAIEKYVNKKAADEDLDNQDKTGRDETVHTDLSAFYEVYTYDIQAYITNDAKYVLVNDKLRNVLEFAGDAPVRVVVKDAAKDANGNNAAPVLTAAEGQKVLTKDADYRIDEQAWKNNELILTMGSTDEDAKILDDAGKWLQITFDAKIKEQYKNVDSLKAEGVDVWTIIRENDPIDAPDAVDEFSGSTGETHEGILNDADYKIKKVKTVEAGADIENDWDYELKSNIVTVQPRSSKVTFSKTDLGGNELEGAVIRVTDEEGNVVEEWISGKEDHILDLKDGEYTMTEVAAPAGYQQVTTEMVFEVKDGVATLKTVEVNGGGKVSCEDNHIVLADAPEKPAIEKYVNKKTDNLADEERDGTVHTDLSAFDEVYTYDIQAYITPDATVVEVTDELKSVLEFAGKKPVAVVVKDGEGKNGAVAPKLTKEGTAVKYTLDKDAWKAGRLVLTIGKDSNNAPKLYPEGKWLQITFDVKIKDQYKSIEALRAAGADAWETIKVNEEIDDADVVNEFSGAKADAHEGIVNDSSYRIKSVVNELNVNVDNEWAYEVKSNTVTVQPPTTEVSISKTDLGGNELEGATIKVVAEDGTIVDEWTSTTEDHVLNLKDGVYTMIEVVAPAGYQQVTTEMVFEVKDGVATLKTVEVNGGGKVSCEDNHIVLADAPEKPAIEKYVNKKTDNLADEERDGTVHTDLSAFDEVYTYDIQAYITPDAKVVEVTDELKSVLEFAGKKPVAVVVKDGEGKSGAAAPKLTKAGEAPAYEYSVDTEAWKAGKLVLTMGSDAKDAKALYPNGKWLQITFDAKIKDTYKSIEDLKTAGADVWSEITENGDVDDADVANVDYAFSGAEAGAHDGIMNDASYRMKSIVAGLNVDNEWAYEVKSNTVTVQPKSTKVTFTKTDLDGEELEGAEMVLTDAEGNVIATWTSTTEPHELNLADGEYVLTEKVAPEGYYCVTTAMHFVVKDQKVTLLTAEVDAGGQLMLMEGNNIVLEDAPLIAESDDEGDDDGEDVKSVYEKEKEEEPVVEKTVSNDEPEKEKDKVKGIKTGDNSEMTLWIVMMILAAATAIVTIIRRRSAR